MKLEGSCHCGAVRFSVESHTPYPFNLCYCSICRKTTGAGGYAINLMGEAKSLKVTGRRNLAVYRARMNGGRSHARRHVGEERRHLSLDANGGIGRLHPLDVVGTRLLGDIKPLALRIGKQSNRRRHRIGKELFALAAAEHHNAERRVPGRRRIGRLCRLQHLRPDRIAGRHRPGACGA